MSQCRPKQVFSQLFVGKTENMFISAHITSCSEKGEFQLFLKYIKFHLIKFPEFFQKTLISCIFEKISFTSDVKKKQKSAKTVFSRW